MSSKSTIVLKLGGSVLQGPASLPLAIQEVERSLRSGLTVVVVVSAFSGRTDELQSELLLQTSPGSAVSGAARTEPEVASHLAQGELEAARAVAEALSDSGLDASAPDLHDLGLVAEGPALGADDACVELEWLEQALSGRQLLVVPGFIARRRNSDETLLLGRGGSDWSALLLADALRSIGRRVRCRLIKDVDGLYESDPHTAAAQPRRYRSVRFEDLPELGRDPGRAIVQPRALAFARARELPIEIATWNQTDHSLLGAETTEFGPARRRHRSSVGLIGCGAVGSVVAASLLRDSLGLELISILVRDASRSRAEVDADLCTDDPECFFASQPEIVVELCGGIDRAQTFVERALREGRSVVTANKALLAEHGERLDQVATEHGADLLFSASVGGGVPVLETARALRDHRVLRVRGVLNGASNFILERLRRGETVDDALRHAREAGLCEADARLDLEGHDAAQKLSLIARALGHGSPSFEFRPGRLGSLRQQPDWPIAAVMRQVAMLQIAREGEACRALASVRLEQLQDGDPLFDLPGPSNRVVFELADGDQVCVSGVGAGLRPTARSVLQDLLTISRSAAMRPEPAR